jgi:hypothetical protein
LVCALGLLSTGATLALWRPAGVFIPFSLWWWASSGVVWAGWLLVGFAAWAAWSKHAVLLGAAVTSPAGLLLALGLAGRLSFFATPPRFWAGVSLLGAMWLIAFARTIRAFQGRARGAVLAGMLAGAPLGAAWVRAQVPPPPGTLPSLSALPPHRAVAAPDGVVVAQEVITLPCGRARLTLWPLLTFRDSSRDGFWPGVAPTPFEGPPPLEGPERRAELTVSAVDGGVLVEATTWLPKPLHSHLNAFTELEVEGLVAPRVRFAAVPNEAFEMRAFDYPQGRPARFAYLSAAGQLEVAQGTDAEKGPFSQLGHGPLARGAPLTVSLLDGDGPVCVLDFLDFTAQADTTLSPAAGEGVATNVLQFGIPVQPPGPPMLHLSLAETGIGAGRPAVTHERGVYRNRVLLRPVQSP